jgi:hypothetical protein
MRTTTTTTSLMLALASLAATAASCASVEADVPEITVTQKSVGFQGIPAGWSSGETSMTQTFVLSSDDLSWAKDLNAEVYASEVEIKALGEMQDLGFIHYARITMSDGATNSTTPAVEIVNYERPESATSSPVIRAKTAYPIDVTKVWAAKKVVITMQLGGVFPDHDWSADVTLHMSGKISYKF